MGSLIGSMGVGERFVFRNMDSSKLHNLHDCFYTVSLQQDKQKKYPMLLLISLGKYEEMENILFISRFCKMCVQYVYF